MTPAHDRYRHYLETLTVETLTGLSEHVTEDVRFKDPFNDVRGIDAMARVFQHMFENVQDIRFHVRCVLSDGDTCLMEWRFEGMLGDSHWCFDGASRVTFASDGRVREHIDYWDAAANFYERLPIIGWLLARLRKRLEIR